MRPALTSDLQKQLEEVLGPGYRIDRELGGAGMSRVFVATETDLERQVVVKVLPPDLSAGINTDRFRREIQLAARLQHPHIVPLHTAGAKGGLLYYTMPFIVGENLRVLITRKRELPVQEATKILREIADALSYAHSQGVVHRDIKPENILISGNHALVLDFGVSKALSSATAETSTEGPTLTSLGIALGTPTYMAPEQAAADPNVDARADIYALGVVGYELLTGRPPFAGLNQQQTLSAHITTAPAPVTQHRPQLPAQLATAIMRSLEKHPSDRWQTAGEVYDALEPYAMTSGATAPSQAVARKPFRWTPQRIGVAAGVVGIVVTGFIASTFAFRSDDISITTGNTRQVTIDPGLEVHPAISPDGRMIAFAAGPWDRSQIFVRQLSGGRAIALSDSTAAAVLPRWSADGSQVMYSSQRASYAVPALGGIPSSIAGLDSLAACSSSSSGDRFACIHGESGALVVAGSRDQTRTVISQGGDIRSPAWSPDDRLIAFTRGNPTFLGGDNIGNFAPSSVWIVSADGGEPVRITGDTHLNMSPIWTPDGAVLFVSSLGGNRDIYMQRISRDLTPRGEPVRLTTGLNAHTISLDRAGKTLAYSVFTTIANIWSTPIPTAPVESPPLHQITRGNQTIESAYISPDGQWLAYDSNINGNQDIFRMPVRGGEAQQLTRNMGDNFNPTWSPDGKEIAFHGLVKGNRDSYVMDAAGRNIHAVVATPREEMAPVFQPDGKTIFFLVLPDSIFETRRDPKNPASWGKPRFVRKGPSGILISPDNSKWFFRAGNGEVCPDCPPGAYVTSPGGGNPRRLPLDQIPEMVASFGFPMWSTDSRHIYLSAREKDGASVIWQLPFDGDPERRILRLPYPDRQFYRLSLSLDATHFYFPLGDRQSDIWTMELKKR